MIRKGSYSLSGTLFGLFFLFPSQPLVRLNREKEELWIQSAYECEEGKVRRL